MADLTIGNLPKALGPTTVGDSQITDNGGAGVEIAGTLYVSSDEVQVKTAAGIILASLYSTDPAGPDVELDLQTTAEDGIAFYADATIAGIGAFGGIPLVFFVFDGNREVLRLNTDKSALFAGPINISGATSGTLSLQAPAAAGASIITFPVGTTNFPATGGPGQVLQQATLGGPITVGALTAADVGVSGSYLPLTGGTLSGRFTSPVGNSLGSTVADYTNDLTGGFTRITYSTQTRPASNAGGGTVFSWNYSGGLAENVLWNTFEGLTGGFSFKQKTGAVHTDLAFLTLTGLLIGNHGVATPLARLHLHGPSATARIYNAYTDASNGEWAYLGDWSAGVARYGTDKNGTGVVRDVSLLRGGAEQVRLAASGTIVAGTLQVAGASAMLMFNDRTSTLVWGWYADVNVARLWYNGGDLVTVNTVGVLTAPVVSIGAANGQSTNDQTLSELTTIAAAAATTTAIQIPARSLVLGVTVRVTAAIPTAATFTVGVTGAAARYGTGIATAINTTFNSPPTDNVFYYAAATGILITPNLTPGTNVGRVRVTIHYITFTPPTS